MYSEDGSNGSPLNSRVLVLNKLYTAVKVITARRAFILLYKNSAEVVAKDNGTFATYDFSRWIEASQGDSGRDGDEFIHTPARRLKVPQVIRLFSYDKIPRREVKFSRKNILSRDDNRCQYCGKHYPATQLSIDHIIPRSRGGSSKWDNLVASCSKCNTKKGGKSPQEAGMKLIRKPIIPPTNLLLFPSIKGNKYHLWDEFLTEKDKNII